MAQSITRIWHSSRASNRKRRRARTLERDSAAAAAAVAPELLELLLSVSLAVWSSVTEAATSYQWMQFERGSSTCSSTTGTAESLASVVVVVVLLLVSQAPSSTSSIALGVVESSAAAAWATTKRLREVEVEESLLVGDGTITSESLMRLTMALTVCIRCICGGLRRRLRYTAQTTPAPASREQVKRAPANAMPPLELVRTIAGIHEEWFHGVHRLRALLLLLLLLRRGGGASHGSGALAPGTLVVVVLLILLVVLLVVVLLVLILLVVVLLLFVLVVPCTLWHVGIVE